MKRISCAWLAVCLLWLVGMVTPSAAATLWYNGDYFATTNPIEIPKSHVPNEISSSINGKAYDDFVVSGGGWTISALYSNNVVYNTTLPDYYTAISVADWEIRQGVSPFDGGTLLMSGTSAATATLVQAYDGTGTYQVRVEVSGLNLSLADGTYWLCVTPHTVAGTGGNIDALVTTGGNAFGYIPGHGYLNYWGTFFDGASMFGGDIDFSLGINGTYGMNPVPTPLPASVLLLGSALLGVSLRGFWRRGQKTRPA
jgi:hypothetical protein